MLIFNWFTYFQALSGDLLQYSTSRDITEMCVQTKINLAFKFNKEKKNLYDLCEKSASDNDLLINCDNNLKCQITTTNKYCIGNYKYNKGSRDNCICFAPFNKDHWIHFYFLLLLLLLLRLLFTNQVHTTSFNSHKYLPTICALWINSYSMLVKLALEMNQSKYFNKCQIHTILKIFVFSFL